MDEQAAKKEEIEAAEDEEAGILPQPLMLQSFNPGGGQNGGTGRAGIGSDEDEDEMSEDEYFY